MNKALPILAFCIPGIILASASVSAESDLLLEPRDISRYETIWTRSPFVAVTDLSGQVDDLAGRFVLTGFARMGEQDVIFLFDRTSLERFKLTPGETRQGIALQSLQHEGDLKSVRATVASGGRSLELTYDPAQQPDGGPPMQQMPFMQGQPGQPGGQPVRVYPGQPGQPMQPGQPGMVQQPNQPGGVIMGQGGQQTSPQNNPNQIVGAAPDTGEPPPPPRRVIRRRAIVAPE